MIDDEKKKQIKKDIKDRVVAGGVGSGVGYLSGAVYGVGKTHREYIKERTKYINKKTKGRKITPNMKKQIIEKFDNKKVPVKNIIDYVNIKEAVPRKSIYNTKMQMEGARLGIKGALKGMPLGVAAYSAYDLNRDKINRIKKKLKGESINGNKL